MTTCEHLAGGKPASANDFILQRRERIVRAALPLSGAVLLDFGCGNGAQTRCFFRDFDTVIGADVSAAFLRDFQAMARLGHGDHGANAIQYDGRTLPISDGSVDVVVSFEVLEHVEDEGQALREIHRVLKPGGFLGISVPNRWWIFETHGARLPLLPWNRVPFFSWLPKAIHDRYAHARIYRRREIVRKLQERGFTVLQSAYVTAPMDVVRWEPLRDALRSTVFGSDRTTIPFKATAIFVAAVKS